MFKTKIHRIIRKKRLLKVTCLAAFKTPKLKFGEYPNSDLLVQWQNTSHQMRNPTKFKQSVAFVKEPVAYSSVTFPCSTWEMIRVLVAAVRLLVSVKRESQEIRPVCGGCFLTPSCLQSDPQKDAQRPVAAERRRNGFFEYECSGLLQQRGWSGFAVVLLLDSSIPEFWWKVNIFLKMAIFYIF